MFFADPVAAFTNIAQALRPGGRLVLLVWQKPTDNEWITEFTTALAAGRPLPTPPIGAPGPFSLADPDRARQLLTTAGFANPTLDDVRVPMCFGAHPAESCQF